MLRLMKGFKASLNVSSGKQTSVGHYDSSPGVTLTGAYRVKHSEFGGNQPNLDPPKKITPSMVKLPSSNPIERQSKSTSDLTRPLPQPIKSNSNKQTNNNLISNSTPNVSQVNNRLTKNQIKEQKKIEKRRLLEQKKREKLAAQEQKKQEKLRNEREKQIQKNKQTQRRSKKVRKQPAPQPTPVAVSQTNTVQVVQNNTVQVYQDIPIRHLQKNPIPVPQNNIAQTTPQYSTNTLESSISRSSGPPPYSPPEVVPNKRDNTGNTSFTAAEDSSWDLISQHRQQINRPKITQVIPKQTHLDLQYNIGTPKTREDNSEV